MCTETRSRSVLRCFEHRAAVPGKRQELPHAVTRLRQIVSTCSPHTSARRRLWRAQFSGVISVETSGRAETADARAVFERYSCPESQALQLRVLVAIDNVTAFCAWCQHKPTAWHSGFFLARTPLSPPRQVAFVYAVLLQVNWHCLRAVIFLTLKHVR